MDGLLVLSGSGSLILRSSFLAPATYPLAISDAIIHLLNSSSLPPPPIFYLPSISPLTFCNSLNSFSPHHHHNDNDSTSSSTPTHHSHSPPRASTPIDHHPPFSSHQPWADPLIPNHQQDSPPHALHDQLRRSQSQHQAQLGSICCNLFKHDLWLACVASSDMEPSIIFEFLNRFIELVSTKYVDKPLGPTTIEANFELVHMLLSLTAPTRESPFGKNWSEAGLVDELVPNPRRSLVKMLSQAAETLFVDLYTPVCLVSRKTELIGFGHMSCRSKGKKVSGSKSSIFHSNIPWRPTGIEYAKQEILLDFTEKVSAILDRDGKPIKLSILGVVDVQSRLSGMADLVLKFTDPGKISEAGFHGCVRTGRWASKRVVSFVPPDGPFRLMSYTALPPLGPPPVVIRPTVTHGRRGGSFALRLAAHAPLVSVAIRWHLGPAATGIVAEQLNCRRQDGSRADVRWEWDELLKSVCMTIDGDDAADCCLSGLWTHSDEKNQPSHAIGIEFEGKSGSPSLTGLKVDKLEICEEVDNQGFGVQNQTLSGSLGGRTSGGISSSGNYSGGGGGSGIRKGVKIRFENSKYEVRW